jgi:hypothetical protein
MEGDSALKNDVEVAAEDDEVGSKDADPSSVAATALPAFYVGIKAEFVVPRAAWAPTERKEGSSETQEKREKTRGRNAKRPRDARGSDGKLCSNVLMGKECPYGEQCRFDHDTLTWLKTKPAVRTSCFGMPHKQTCDKYAYSTHGHRCHARAMHKYGQIVV